LQGEQPAIREEGIGPALMVAVAASDARALVLLAQDGAQAAADNAVEDAEQSWCGVLEIAKPAPQQRVEVVDDPLQTVAAAAARQASHFIPRFREGRLLSAFRLFLRTSRRPAANR
jgi:hypothetical protein